MRRALSESLGFFAAFSTQRITIRHAEGRRVQTVWAWLAWMFLMMATLFAMRVGWPRWGRG